MKVNKVTLKTTFLLQFLRRCKFSQLEARKMLDNFHTKTCDHLPFWMCNIDVHKPALRDLIINQKIYIPLPYRDDEGRRILLFQLGHFDVGKDILYNFHDYVAYNGVTMMMANREEETQVNGYVLLIDLTDQTMKHMTFMPMEFRRKLYGLFSKQLPARMKSIIAYNAGPVWEAMWNLTGHFLSAKIRERLSYCKTMEDVYKLVPMRCLPREYLPDDYKGPCAGNLADITRHFYSEVSKPAVRDRILELSTKYFKVDDSKRPAVTDAEVASFRKLHVD
ncbi:unnamed protein product [Owenia fusiformis]|uniref:Uncharacterized protein n=1 Tax=Owenia fusiformis TaxID=6347 RepID=A0A8J1XXV0_OWEFU|nr:unnamed protein product [Owenia fusiformis]